MKPRAGALRYFGQIKNGTTPASGEAEYWDGDVKWATPEDLGKLAGDKIASTRRQVTQKAVEETNLSVLPVGSVLISTRAPIGHMAITEEPMAFNQGCRGIIPGDGVHGPFLYYLLKSRTPQLNAMANGTTFVELSRDELAAVQVSFPPLETQRRIARFLDEKTARIDGLIEKKRALLDRLAEKRQTLITRAVTKGLNPAAPMKASGIDWLGDIPAHWDMKRLSFISDLVDCKHRTPEYIDEGIPLVSTSEIKPYSIDYLTKRQVSEDEFALMSEGGRKLIQGDIVYSRNASVGSAAQVRSNQLLCLGQDLCIIRPLAASSDFLEHFLNSGACLEQLNRELVGATFKRVNVDVIRKYFVLLPPEQEQRDIVRQLHEVLAREALNSQKVAQSVDLLIEYRAAIVTSAVTGQIAGLQ